MNPTELAAQTAAVYAFWGLVVQSVTTVLVALGVPWFAYLMAAMKRDMQLLERNTNSIKDELVAVTRTAAHAAGVLAEKERTGQR